jgi:hypothetical protein
MGQRPDQPARRDGFRSCRATRRDDEGHGAHCALATAYSGTPMSSNFYLFNRIVEKDRLLVWIK